MPQTVDRWRPVPQPIDRWQMTFDARRGQYQSAETRLTLFSTNIANVDVAHHFNVDAHVVFMMPIISLLCIARLCLSASSTYEGCL